MERLGPERKNEPIGSGYYICTDKRFRISGDGIFLANFAVCRHLDLVTDLCCGCGVISLLLARNAARSGIELKQTGVELQKPACDLARKGNALSGAKINFIHSDIRAVTKEISKASQDVILCNPPYYREKSGRRPKVCALDLARTESALTLDQALKTASFLLKPLGRFYICYPPQRLADLFVLLRGNHLEPKRIRFVQETVDRAPWLILCEARKNGKSFLTMEPSLIIKEKSAYTAEAEGIFKVVK